jgi:hypothetical protein
MQHTALNMAAAELITGAIFILLVLVWSGYEDAQKRRGPWRK